MDIVPWTRKRATESPLSKRDSLVGEVEEREVIYGAPREQQEYITDFRIPIKGASLDICVGFRETERRGPSS